MNFHCWRAVPITFVALICLAGCKGHFKFSDDQYRALGSPEPSSRLGALRQGLTPRKEVSDALHLGLSDMARSPFSSFDAARDKAPYALSIFALRQDFQE